MWWMREMPPETRDPVSWAMARELMRILQSSGKYAVSDLARRCADKGRPHSRETISRVLNGKQPGSQELIEDLAIAAGVDLAYLQA